MQLKRSVEFLDAKASRMLNVETKPRCVFKARSGIAAGPSLTWSVKHQRNRTGGPSGTRSNLHNSNARFHSTLIVGSLPLLAALTGSVSMWLRGLDLNQRPLGYEGVGAVHSGRHPAEGAGISAPPFRLVGRLSDGQPGKCTESSSGQPGHFTERPSVRREPALLASVVSPKTRLGPPLASNGPTAVVGNGAMTPALLTIPSAFENLSRPI